MTDEAKRVADALVYCNESAGCEGCPVFGESRPCMNDRNAASLIERLSAELEAAKNDMNHIAADACLACRHIDKAANIGVKRKGTPCENCGRYSLKFEWRGVCDENGGKANGR